MKTQIKIFDNEYPDRLTEEINSFLEGKILVDIKYTSCRSSEDYGEEILFSALVIFKEDSQ